MNPYRLVFLRMWLLGLIINLRLEASSPPQYTDAIHELSLKFVEDLAKLKGLRKIMVSAEKLDPGLDPSLAALVDTALYSALKLKAPELTLLSCELCQGLVASPTDSKTMLLRPGAKSLSWLKDKAAELQVQALIEWHLVLNAGQLSLSAKVLSPQHWTILLARSYSLKDSQQQNFEALRAERYIEAARTAQDYIPQMNFKASLGLGYVPNTGLRADRQAFELRGSWQERVNKAQLGIALHGFFPLRLIYAGAKSPAPSDQEVARFKAAYAILGSYSQLFKGHFYDYYTTRWAIEGGAGAFANAFYFSPMFRLSLEGFFGRRNLLIASLFTIPPGLAPNSKGKALKRNWGPGGSLSWGFAL